MKEELEADPEFFAEYSVSTKGKGGPGAQAEPGIVT